MQLKRPRHIGLVIPGQNIVVNRLRKEEWTVKHCLRVSRVPLRNLQKVIICGKRVHMCCSPEDGRLNSTRSGTEYLHQQQHTLGLDSHDSLVWTFKHTHKVLTFTWTCRATRPRRSFRKKKN